MYEFIYSVADAACSLGGSFLSFCAVGYITLPSSVKKNLKKIYLLHWSLTGKMVLAAVSPMISPKFWQKVVYVEQLSDFLATLQMPASEALWYVEVDRHLHLHLSHLRSMQDILSLCSFFLLVPSSSFPGYLLSPSLSIYICSMSNFSLPRYA